MHAVVMESLEEYLSGTLEPAAQREIEAHLNICASCREEIRSMQEVSQMFLTLRSEEALEASAGFYRGCHAARRGAEAGAVVGRACSAWISHSRGGWYSPRC